MRGRLTSQGRVISFLAQIRIRNGEVVRRMSIDNSQVGNGAHMNNESSDIVQHSISSRKAQTSMSDSYQFFANSPLLYHYSVLFRDSYTTSNDEGHFPKLSRTMYRLDN